MRDEPNEPKGLHELITWPQAVMGSVIAICIAAVLIALCWAAVE